MSAAPTIASESTGYAVMHVAAVMAVIVAGIIDLLCIIAVLAAAIYDATHEEAHEILADPEIVPLREMPPADAA